MRRAVDESVRRCAHAPRILILTSSTGSGHDTRAKAVKRWIQEMYGESVEVRIEHLIERSSRIGSFGVWLYNQIQRYCPFLHHLYWQIVEIIVASHTDTVQFGGSYYRKLLTDFQPQLILSVHDSLNRGYFEDAYRVLGTDKVKCVTYCGEWSGGYGFSQNWVNPNADLFYARNEEARDFAVSLGMPFEKTRIFRKLLPPRDFYAPMPAEERLVMLRDELGLEPDKFTVFLATGGFGANHHIRFLRMLLPMAEKVQAIVVCGRNQRIFDRVKAWGARHPELRLFLEGYSNQVNKYLQISDAVVTRGGANSTAEAVHFGCPMIYNTFGGLMPQEHLTVNHFERFRAAEMVRSDEDFRGIMRRWADRGPAYLEVLHHLLSLQNDEDPRDFVAELVALATSVCPTREVSPPVAAAV